MSKAYISGALSNLKNPDEIKGFYEAIAETCSRYGFIPHVPHLYTDPIKHADVSPREVFKQDKSIVMTSDLVIAYVGIPSLGVGMELAFADVAGLPTILLYEQGQYVSRFPRGMPTLLAEIQFTDYRDALVKLGDVLENLTHQQLVYQRSEDNASRTRYLSPKEVGSMEELHIEVSQEPGSTTQHLAVKDGSDRPVLIADIPLDDRDSLRRELLHLADRGIMPKRVYVGHFTKITDIVKTVWSDSEVYLTYR